MKIRIAQFRYKSSHIYIRKPPENGVDLYYPDLKSAFQCKSTESSDSNGHNLTKIKQSFERALEIKKELDWNKYYLCTNYDLTGKQESNLKKELPEIQVLSKSYWLRLCEKYPIQVEDNFRVSITISDYQISKTINDTFIPEYSQKLQKELENNPYEIFVYCNRNNKIYKLLVSESFEVEDIINILMKVWNLPEPKDIGGFNFSISYSLVFNNKRHPLNHKLSDIGLSKDSIVTFWTTVSYSDNSGKSDSGDFIHMITSSPIESRKERLNKAMDKYENMIKESFKKFDEEQKSR